MNANLWAALRILKKHGAITHQAYNTYKGLILSGNAEAAIKGLKRKGLIIIAEE